MDGSLDRSLDELLAERKPDRRGGRNSRNNNSSNDRNSSSNNNGGRRHERERRDEYPRDGVRKSYRDDTRKIDEEWVHDRYEDSGEHHVKPARAARASPERGAAPSAARGTRVRVENLHYDLTRQDLEGLFAGVGPVLSLELVYDRAGRSDGVAYITYEAAEDARAAVREFDGAKAKGQVIRLAIVGGGRGGGRSQPGTLGAGRPLAERITRPRGEDGGEDEDGDEDDSRTSLAAAARHNIDRYVPGAGSNGGGSRSHSHSRSSPRPGRRREGGRRPGERRGGDGNNSSSSNNNNNGGTNGSNRRPRKTQEELDAEMADYFVAGSAAAAPAAVAPADADDSEMIG